MIIRIPHDWSQLIKCNSLRQMLFNELPQILSNGTGSRRDLPPHTGAFRHCYSLRISWQWALTIWQTTSPETYRYAWRFCSKSKISALDWHLAAVFELFRGGEAMASLDNICFWAVVSFITIYVASSVIFHNAWLRYILSTVNDQSLTALSLIPKLDIYTEYTFDTL